jgi:hypothetical protein
MAYLADYLTPDDRQRQLAAGSPISSGAPASSGGGTAGTSPTTVAPQDQGNPTGWVNLQDYLGANQAQAQQMGQGIAADLSGKAQDASAPAMAAPTVQYDSTLGSTHTTTPAMTDAQRQEGRDTTQAFGALTGGDQGARQGYLEGQYGGQGGYSQGMSGMDAYLLGGAGMQPVQSAQAQWADPLAKAAGYQPTDTTTYNPIQIDPGTHGVPVPEAAPSPAPQQHGRDYPDVSNPAASPGGRQDAGEWTWNPQTNEWERSGANR